MAITLRVTMMADTCGHHLDGHNDGRHVVITLRVTMMADTCGHHSNSHNDGRHMWPSL